MKYRALGATGLSVSIIGFGASALGDVYGQVSHADGDAAVHAAIDAGINLFDVAPYYGLTLAETRLGEALGCRRKEIILATKVARYGAAQFDFSAATVVREFEASLRRLQTDYVDLLQVHDVEFGSTGQILNETLPALRQLQQQGKARFIGITGYWPAFLATLAKATSVDTVLNYCHWNLLMDDMDATLTPMAAETGIGLMNASPMHMGLLGGGDVPAWHPAPAAVKQVARQVIDTCRQAGVSPARVALHACLANSAVASTFVGLGSAAQVADSIIALDFQADPQLLASIRQLVAPVFNTVWPSGKPENQPEAAAHAH